MSVHMRYGWSQEDYQNFNVKLGHFSLFILSNKDVKSKREKLMGGEFQPATTPNSMELTEDSEGS